MADELAHAGPNVLGLGFVSGENKWRALAAADFLVHTSTVLPDGRTEGSPVAILEALAVGRPVVAAAVGGVGELIEPGRTGWLVSDGDLDQFVTAVRQAARRARSMADRALWEARKHAWPRVAAVLGELLAQAESEVRR